MSVEINIELLLGTRVRDINGEVIGRIEELKAERRDKDCLVESYLIGASGAIERLSAWSLVRPIAKALRSRKVPSVYQIDWEEMDLSDPLRPKFRKAKSELRRAP
jgi:hypothetical protein